MAELDTYRARRDGRRTPEPVPPPAGAGGHGAGGPAGKELRFVVQEHHARALHWDVRLERDGVLVSWAVPKGLPLDRHVRRLAVHTEDHPLEYAAFEGEIPAGEYGGGTVTVWDRGTYDLEHWSDDEVKVVLHGQRVRGRYVLVRTGGRRGSWMVQRMDEPDQPRRPLPDAVAPMLAVPGRLPEDDAGWGYEFKWDGVRAVARVDGGRITLTSRNGRDVTVSYPELRALGEALAGHQAVLDGEIVAFDGTRPDFGRLQQRMHVADPARARRLAERVPVSYLLFDLLHLDGADTTALPYRERRRLLDGLGLQGPHWLTPPWFDGGGRAVWAAARDQGLEGVVAKRLDAPYQPGQRSRAFVKVKLQRTQEVVVGGWTAGEGRRRDRIGALLLGLPGPGGLRYAGKVGTGFRDRDLDDLAGRFAPLQRDTSPFAEPLPKAQQAAARWVEPVLVGEVTFTEWTADGRLRHPSWRGLRPDKEPGDVVVEP